MVQNRKTGASANRFGRETATKIARLIGAKKLSKNSNEVTYNEIRSVIKCARGKNFYIGVTYKMLERISLIIAAFEEDTHFDLYTLSDTIFQENMRDAIKNPVGLVQKKVFIEEGAFLTSLKIK